MAKILDSNIIPPLKAQTLAQAKHHPFYALNLAVANDTPTGWKDILEGKNGNYLVRYSIADKFTSQIQQYGILETYLYADDIYQRWRSMPFGPSYERSGNAIGWDNSASVTSSDAWAQVNTNKTTGFGGGAINMRNTDLNNYPNVSGLYIGYQGGHVPSAVATTTYSVLNIKWPNGDNVIQLLLPLYGSAIYTRRKQNGTWTDWVSK